ncbi:acetate--CoA ligase family protein [Tamaricihabitans halophyticus]|uniref:acetate--CoA ligase family protein n=1 Tax=Tamaricihabitans halophyticus TaxID=1262583 RepID=UPI001A9D21FB|nr:acetate--CoA ligase family protein [Tamaricihabitans halophyticus]
MSAPHSPATPSTLSAYRSPCQPTGLARMFHPRSIALVGVSSRPESLNARPLRFLLEHGFGGGIFPVNPNHNELFGVRCYPSLADIPEPVDLVLVLVPAAGTIEVIRQAGAIGAHTAVVFSSGFAETGAEGTRLQEELREVARATGVRVVGPNCQGLVYAPTGMAATFTAAAARPFRGHGGVAYVGQSGAVGGSILDMAREMGLRLTAWASTGNQADLDLVDVASALVSDEEVDVLMLYAESIRDGEAYIRLAEQAMLTGKRLVVLRSGKSAAGQRAVTSHTGAMLGDQLAFELASRRYGVILVADVDELLAVSATLQTSPPPAGPRIGVITTSGGAGSLAADHLAGHGLDLPTLAADTQDRLAPLIPDFGALGNPVDVTAQLFNQDELAGALGKVCGTVADDDQIDAIAIVLTMVTGELGARLAADIVATARESTKPVLVAWLAGPGQTQDGRAIFREAGIPVFPSVGALARTAARCGSAVTVPRPDRSDSIVDPAETVELLRGCAAGELRPEAVLTALGVPQPENRLVRTAEEAARAAAELDGELAMKIAASGLEHKSDIGGVRLAVPGARATEVFGELTELAARHGVTDLHGVLLQRMLPEGVELIVGATCAADGYPPIITIGFGGVTTELYRDVTSELAPVRPWQVRDMLRRLRGWPLLSGFRGNAPCDVDAVATVVTRLSTAVAPLAGHPFELEINPLIVAAEGGGACAADVLISGMRQPK